MIDSTVMMQKDEKSSTLMKAVVRERYGSPDVLQIKESMKPAPDDVRGVLVKIFASSINPADRYEMTGGPNLLLRIVVTMQSGLFKPKDPRIGTDIAGRVEAVSNSVTQFKPGDEIYGVCIGAYAEYGTAKETKIALKPKNRSFEEAASVPIAGITALQALRDHGHIQHGQKVLINGAGGGVGTFAVQIAKSFGAEVTAVTSAQNLDMLRKLGADHVVDYSKEDFTRNGQRYDLVVDIAASHSTSDYKRIMNTNAIFVLVGMKDKILRRLLSFIVRSKLSRGDKKFVFFVAKTNHEDFVALKDMMESGKIVPVIDRRYSLGETAKAMQYLIEGGARGKIVITVDHADDNLARSQQAPPI